MSEIICFYNYANDEKDSGCFILESNVELNDFKQFLVESNLMDPTQVLLDDNSKLIEPETFTLLRRIAAANDASMSITIASPVAKKKAEEPFGPMSKQILASLNIDCNNIDQLSDIIDRIPFPFSYMARGYLANIRANPDAIEQIVQAVAPGYTSQAAPLIAEVKQTLAFFDRKEREREEELRKQKEEAERQERELELAKQEREQRQRELEQENKKLQEQEKEREFIGPVMKQILDYIDIEILIDTKDIPILVQYIPSAYMPLVTSVIKKLAENVFHMNYCVRYIAQLLHVAEDALVDEVQYAFNCIREAISAKVEEGKKELVKHQALCDKCRTMIAGVRYKCLHCADYDLCSECEEKNAHSYFHDESHVFAKIHSPSNTLSSAFLSAQSRRTEGCHQGRMAAHHNRIVSLEASVEELRQTIAALSQNKL